MLLHLVGHTMRCGLTDWFIGAVWFPGIEWTLRKLGQTYENVDARTEQGILVTGMVAWAGYSGSRTNTAIRCARLTPPLRQA